MLYIIFSSGICVPHDFLCDNTNDCGNLYDETECDEYLPMCTFEEDEECDWNQENEQDDIGIKFSLVVIFHDTCMNLDCM